MCCTFFFNDTATTEIYTLSLHDALPISRREDVARQVVLRRAVRGSGVEVSVGRTDGRIDSGLGRGSENAYLLRRIVDLDRKSTRLNSSHANISYAVFCLKKINFIEYLKL